MFCDFRDPSKCLICDSGYFMNNLLNCVKEPNFVWNVVNVKNINEINQEKLLIITALNE